mmetsp:Transcript_44527/g.96880  ORF Transcript_44527/g.96880 Transcript_44527/m.96880 type:complete len:262 (+) Transcript_44527:622-1407(+)
MQIPGRIHSQVAQMVLLEAALGTFNTRRIEIAPVQRPVHFHAVAAVTQILAQLQTGLRGRAQRRAHVGVSPDTFVEKTVAQRVTIALGTSVGAGSLAYSGVDVAHSRNVGAEAEAVRDLYERRFGLRNLERSLRRTSSRRPPMPSAGPGQIPRQALRRRHLRGSSRQRSSTVPAAVDDHHAVVGDIQVLPSHLNRLLFLRLKQIQSADGWAAGDVQSAAAHHRGGHAVRHQADLVCPRTHIGAQGYLEIHSRFPVTCILPL